MKFYKKKSLEAYNFKDSHCPGYNKSVNECFHNILVAVVLHFNKFYSVINMLYTLIFTVLSKIWLIHLGLIPKSQSVFATPIIKYSSLCWFIYTIFRVSNIHTLLYHNTFLTPKINYSLNINTPNHLCNAPYFKYELTHEHSYRLILNSIICTNSHIKYPSICIYHTNIIWSIDAYIKQVVNVFDINILMKNHFRSLPKFNFLPLSIGKVLSWYITLT